MRRRCAITLVGRVQDVGLRSAVRREAARFDLAGWIRNETGDRVVLEAEGEAAPVALFIAWLRSSPGYARPTDVSVMDIAPKGEHEFVVAR